MKVTLVQATPNAVETIAKIASICYDSDPKDPMKLMGAGSGDTFNFESEVDVFKHTVVTTVVEMLHQSHGVLRITVITDGSNLSDGLHCIGRCLHESYFH